MLQVMKNAIFLIFSGDINCNGHQKGIFFFDWRQSLYVPVYDWGGDRSKNGFDFRFIHVKCQIAVNVLTVEES